MPSDTKQIGRELGVRYVLEGSVQRSGNRVRVSAQLIDAETDTHLWADRLDRDAGDLFALQNEITSLRGRRTGLRSRPPHPPAATRRAPPSPPGGRRGAFIRA